MSNLGLIYDRVVIVTHTYNYMQQLYAIQISHPRHQTFVSSPRRDKLHDAGAVVVTLPGARMNRSVCLVVLLFGVSWASVSRTTVESQAPIEETELAARQLTVQASPGPASSICAEFNDCAIHPPCLNPGSGLPHACRPTPCYVPSLPRRYAE